MYQFHNPVASDIEHDPVQLLLSESEDLPDPLATGVINYAIRLFSQTFAHQASSIQQGALEQVALYLAGAVAQQNAAKEQAVTLNVVLALFLALEGATVTRSTASLHSSHVQKALQELLNVRYIVELSLSAC